MAHLLKGAQLRLRRCCSSSCGKLQRENTHSATDIHLQQVAIDSIELHLQQVAMDSIEREESLALLKPVIEPNSSKLLNQYNLPPIKP